MFGKVILILMRLLGLYRVLDPTIYCVLPCANGKCIKNVINYFYSLTENNEQKITIKDAYMRLN